MKYYKRFLNEMLNDSEKIVQEYDDMDEDFQKKFKSFLGKVNHMNPRQITKRLCQIIDDDLNAYNSYDAKLNRYMDKACTLFYDRKKKGNDTGKRFSNAFDSFMDTMEGWINNLHDIYLDRHLGTIWCNNSNMHRITEAYPSFDSYVKWMEKKRTSGRLGRSAPRNLLWEFLRREQEEKEMEEQREAEEELEDWFVSRMSAYENSWSNDEVESVDDEISEYEDDWGNMSEEEKKRLAAFCTHVRNGKTQIVKTGVNENGDEIYTCRICHRTFNCPSISPDEVNNVISLLKTVIDTRREEECPDLVRLPFGMRPITSILNIRESILNRLSNNK